MGDPTSQPDTPDNPKPPAPLPLDYETPMPPGTTNPPYSGTERALVGCGLLSLSLLFVAGLAADPWLSPVVAVLAAGTWFTGLGMFVLSLVERRRQWHRYRGRLLGGLAILVVPFFCVVPILLPSTGRARESAQRVKCSSNLRQIGQAILLYANDNNDVYPDGLPELLLTQDLGSYVMICPSTSDMPASGPTTQDVVASFLKGKHLSYIYVGKGLSSATVSPDMVIAYEPLSNHSGDGMNVLYGDGHVPWVNKAMAKKILDELNAGHNPPRPEKMN